MAIIKKGKVSSPLVVSSMVYVCGGCGFTEIVKDGEPEDHLCVKCNHGKMTLISSKTTEIKEAANKSKNKKSKTNAKK